MSEAIDRLNARLADMTPTARLTFEDKCAAFYLIQRGFKQVLIAEVFGVTQTAISQLARALKPGARKYKNVADEWARIGSSDEFGRIYYTLDIDDRVARARVNSPQPGDLRRGRGANPNLEPFKPFDLDGVHYECVWMDKPGPYDSQGDYDTARFLPATGWTFTHTAGPVSPWPKRFKSPTECKNYIEKISGR